MALMTTPVCEFGEKAVDFSAKDAFGKEYRLLDAMGENGLLIMFICNHCPYVIAVIERLVEDCKAIRKNGVGVVAVMSNDYRSYPDDAPEKMAVFAEQYGFTFPYLIDETQDIAKAYDAICTPDFFGFNRDGELQYRGRIDDAKMQDASNRIPELRQAMFQIAETGTGPQEQSPSMGCSIKWR